MEVYGLVKNKGISLISLVVTIVVMLILIGIVGVYSLDTIKESHEAVAERELISVREYVLRQQIRIIDGEFSIDTDKYSNIVLTSELVYLLGSGKLTDTEINNIIEVNSADIDKNYKYYYFQSENKYFEDSEFSNDNLTFQDVKNDYIINFYTGTIICLSDEFFKVDGIVKGLSEITIGI